MITSLRLHTHRYQIHFDRDYGVDRRTGWSIAIDGHFVVMLEPSIFKAIWSAYQQTP